MKDKKQKNQKQKIQTLRQRIDKLDSQILAMLNKRMQQVISIGEIKEGSQGSFYVPSRENEVYKRLLKENAGPLPKSALKAIFREVMSASLLMEKKLKVAYLGPEGTFTHQASSNKFGQSTIYHPVASIKDVFEEIAKGFCD